MPAEPIVVELAIRNPLRLPLELVDLHLVAECVLIRISLLSEEC